MTKVKNYGNVTIVDDITEAHEHELTFDGWLCHVEQIHEL